MKKTLLIPLYLCQGPYISQIQFNNVCDDNDDGFASLPMQEISNKFLRRRQFSCYAL
jgi:hypothetical protein